MSWTEVLVIVVITIIVVGPKELPGMLRAFGKTLGQVRRHARDFQSQFNEVLREAERQADLEDVRKNLDDVRNLDPRRAVKNAVLGEDDGTKAASGKPLADEAAATGTAPAGSAGAADAPGTADAGGAGEGTPAPAEQPAREGGAATVAPDGTGGSPVRNGAAGAPAGGESAPQAGNGHGAAEGEVERRSA